MDLALHVNKNICVKMNNNGEFKLIICIKKRLLGH